MPPAVFIPDHADVRRAQSIIGGYARTRLEIIAARPGNPRGAEVRQFDGAVALRAPGFPDSAFFNRAYGFCDDHIAHIPALIDWYSAGVGGVFDIAPGRPVAKMARLLPDAGYPPPGFHATLPGPVSLPPRPPAADLLYLVAEE